MRLNIAMMGVNCQQPFETENQDSAIPWDYDSPMTFVQRIQAALDSVETHLPGSVDPAEAAKAACLSRSQFYRLFGVFVGWSFAVYGTKRRLSWAAKRLRDPSDSILAIALDADYGSAEAFTRAFRREFGTTPSRFRKERRRETGLEAISLIEEMMMNVVIKDLPDLSVVSSRALSLSPEEDAWKRLGAWLENPALSEASYRVFGHNDPSPVAVNQPYGYVFHLAFAEDADLPPLAPGLVKGFLPGGHFAVTHLDVQDPSQIPAGWQAFAGAMSDQGLEALNGTKSRWYEEHLDWMPGVGAGPMGMDLYVEISS